MASSDKYLHGKTGFQQEIIYLVILINSFIFGFFISSKYVLPGLSRKLLSAFFGITLIFCTAGAQIGHSLVSFIMVYLIIKFLSKSKVKKQNNLCEWVIFWSVLGYLLFFRLSNAKFPEYFDKVSPFANVVQLLVTLRLISFGFENSSVEDFPGFLDFFCYNFSYLGLFSGPFYRKYVYDDFCNAENLHKIPVLDHVIQTLKPLPLTASLYLILKTMMPVDFYRSEQFLNGSTWMNVLLLQVQFAWCRYRFYTAWMMAESTCITARLGAYKTYREARPGLGPKLAIDPEKESKPEHEIYDFNTIWNLKKIVCEFHPSLRQAMRDWNCSVQYWLANYTYKKVDSKYPIFLRISFTMFISAYWHGIAPGFFMGFMCVPLLRTLPLNGF